MSGSVVIKGSKNGITLVLDENEDFDVLKEKIEKKFKDSAKFLGNAKTALAFDGRELTDDQKDEIVKIITDNTELEIVCLIDHSDDANAVFLNALQKQMMDMTASNAKIHKGNLRSGQAIESDTGIVVLGDVNPGASLVSKGSIIVLGSLRGTVWAGADGNASCFVLSTDMTPMQIRIADTIARSPDRKEAREQNILKIALLDENGSICISPLTKEIINGLSL